MNSKKYTLARIPGDGIGPEVIYEASKVLEAAASKSNFAIEWIDYPFGADYYLRTNEILPDSALKEMASCDALFLGAVGDPRVKPGILERGILLTLRFYFDQYVNLRPAKRYPKVPLPIQIEAGKEFNTLVVRENTEDFYVGIGGITETGYIKEKLELQRNLYSFKGQISGNFNTKTRGAFQMGIASEPGIRRVTTYACKEAERRGDSSITLVSKSNALPQMYGFWEEVTRDEASIHNMKVSIMNVDAMCYHLVRNPSAFNVIVAPNMFGDIVSDLLAGLSGGLGVAAGADIGDSLSMFEPIHGSAPDIAGTGKANPIAALLSGALMLAHLGEREAAHSVERAVCSFLEKADSQNLPMEFGGNGTTFSVTEAICKQID